MEIDMDKNNWSSPCPKVDCRKDTCKCGLRKVTFPAALGDDSEDSPIAPKNGAYCNAIVEYEANGHIYIYSAEGVPTLIDVDASDISSLEKAISSAQKDIVNIQEDIRDIHGDIEDTQEDIDELDTEFIFGFDSIAEMMSSDKLVDGSYVKTLGYYTKGDGGGSYYKIRTTTSSDIDDGATTIIFGGLTAKIITDGHISYDQFGAKGDGLTDDFQRIKATHDYANINNLPVIANAEKTYYVKNIDSEIEVRTSTDWMGAKFIIDDTGSPLNNWLFNISPDNSIIDLTGAITSLDKGQLSCNITGYGNLIVEFQNANKKDFIRTGGNHNQGSNRTEYVRVDNNGAILDKTYFSFSEVTSIRAKKIEDSFIEVKNGSFETKVVTIDSYNYYRRGINVTRSNVIIDNVTHVVVGEDQTGVSSPYDGFIHAEFCANLIIKNCNLSGHKTYYTQDSVSKGSYDLNFYGVVNVTVDNVQQVNDICDTSLWPIHGSNYCKRMTFNNCTISRVDAHRGVYGLTINNCILGKGAIDVVGFGDLIVRETTVKDYAFIRLRGDYGSFWDGTVDIRNCTLDSEHTVIHHIIFADNKQNHDYGYKCYLPNLIVNGFKFNVKDNNVRRHSIIGVPSPTSTPNFSLSYEDNAANDVFPLIFPKTVSIENVKCEEKCGIVYNSYFDPMNAYFEDTGDAYDVSTNKGIFNKNFNSRLTIKNSDLSNIYEVDTTFDVSRNTVFGKRGVQGLAENSNTHRGVILVEIIGCKCLLLSNQGRMVSYLVKDSSIYQINSGWTYNYGAFDIDNCELHCRYVGSPSNDNRCFTLGGGAEIKNSTFIIDNATFSDIANIEQIYRTWTFSGNHASPRYISVNNMFNITDADFDSITDYATYKNRYLWDTRRYSNTTSYDTINNLVGTSSQRPDYNLMAGTTYYSTTEGKVMAYDGASWS